MITHIQARENFNVYNFTYCRTQRFRSALSHFQQCCMRRLCYETLEVPILGSTPEFRAIRQVCWWLRLCK